MPQPSTLTWYCGWCYFGPNSVTYDNSCPNCHREKDGISEIEAEGRSMPPSSSRQHTRVSKSRLRNSIAISSRSVDSKANPANTSEMGGSEDKGNHSLATVVTASPTRTSEKSPHLGSVQGIVHDRYTRLSSTSSLESLTDSIHSRDSVSSASSLASNVPEVKTAFQRIYKLLNFFSDQYSELVTRSSPEKISRNLGRLFKKFARNLEKVAKIGHEKRTARFIRSHARKLAQNLVRSTSFFKTQEAGRNLPDLDDSDDSQSGNVEEAPDDFLDLEAFIMTSDAFGQLRLDIHSLLGRPYIEKSAPVSGNPTLDLSVDHERTPKDMPKALSSLNGRESDFVSSAWSLYGIVQNFLIPESPIQEGMTRIRWRCACGETLYDDYRELKLGAASEMEKYLRRMNHRTHVPGSQSDRRTTKPIFQNVSKIVQLVGNLLRRRNSPALVETELRYYSEARATRNPPPTSAEVYYLLACYHDRSGQEAVRLRQLDVSDIDDDETLFQCLRDEYTLLKTRWRRALSLWSLQRIRFAQFELFSNDLVDVKKLDDVPPPTKDFEYRHGPPNPPEVIPPLGPTFLAHMFKHPELAGTNRHCLNKIPRRLKDRLVVVDRDCPPLGWGLQFVEGWSKKRLMYVIAAIFGLSSSIVMILVSVLGHNIQNAGAIASYILALVTIGVAALQAGMHMS